MAPAAVRSRRPVTRTDILAASLEALQSSRDALQSIDLRAKGTKADMRLAVQNARMETTEAITAVTAALKLDATQ